jgi:hypothetical protein
VTVVSRRVVSTPARSASASWDVIVKLVTAEGSPARDELQRIAGVASCLIAEESLKTDPCVVFGSGPRVRIYCLYNEDAIAGEDTNEAVLTFTPTEGDWQMSLPCAVDDLEWVKKALGERSTHVTVREAGSAVDDAHPSSASASSTGAVIDREAFLRS